MPRKTVISQLQSVGEGALEKLAQSPATRTAVHGAVQVKERGERLLHVLESVGERLTAIEERLAALEKPAKKPAPARARAGTRSTKAAASKTTAPRTPRAPAGKAKSS